MANPTTYFGWVMPNSADLVTDLPADFNVFGQGVDTSMQYLLGGTTGQILSKTSGTNMAFTWINNDQGDITAVTAGTGITGGGTSGAVTVTNDMATTITTAGDLIKGTGSGTYNRLGIGSTGQVLTVASGAPSWATPSSGAMTLITRQTASGVAALTIDNCFTSTYKTYLIVAEKFYAATGTDNLGFELRFGTTNKTGAYYGSSGQLPNNGGALVNLSSSASTFFNLQTDSASGAGNVTMYINQVGQGSGPYPAFNGTAFSITPTYSSSFFGGMCYASEAYHGIVFLSSSSNITIDVAIYGLAAA